MEYSTYINEEVLIPIRTGKELAELLFAYVTRGIIAQNIEIHAVLVYCTI